MPETSPWDLLVVGGGPAGLATAIAARRRGLEVRVIDGRSPPIDKPCGEGLMPDGLERLSALGVEIPQPARPFRGIRYLSDDSVAQGFFPAGPGLGVRRSRLHAALAETASALGVDLVWGLRVDGLEPRSRGRWQVATRCGSLEADWLVAADGLHSRLRRWAGLAAPSHSAPAKRRFGVRRHYEVAPWTDLVEVHWARGCEAYVTPVGPAEVGVALLWSGAKAGFDDLLTRFPALRERIEGAAVISRDRGAGPLWQQVRGVHRGRLALVGDASGYVDALTGEGVALALHQAEALVEALERGNLHHYDVQHRRLRRSPDRATRLTLLLSRFPGLRRRAIAALAADGELFSQLLAIHCRKAGLSSLGVSRALRFLVRLGLPTGTVASVGRL